jgi:hypothetical protein
LSRVSEVQVVLKRGIGDRIYDLTKLLRAVLTSWTSLWWIRVQWDSFNPIKLPSKIQLHIISTSLPNYFPGLPISLAYSDSGSGCGCAGYGYRNTCSKSATLSPRRYLHVLYARSAMQKGDTGVFKTPFLIQPATLHKSLTP